MRWGTDAGAPVVAGTRETGLARAGLASEVLASDRRFFEAGAQTEQIGPFHLALLSSCAPIAAAAVGFVDRELLAHRWAAHDVDGWLTDLEDRLRGEGFDWVRLYAGASPCGLEPILTARAYEPRTEIGFVADARNVVPSPKGGATAVLTPVCTDEDWADKLALHQLLDRAADGYVVSAAAWMSFERAKGRTGLLRSYLVRAEGTDGEIVGAVGVLDGGSVLRMKNLVIHPDRLRRGYGRAAVECILAMGAEVGQPMSCLALGDGIGEQMYRTMGFEQVVETVEWSRRLWG